MTQPTPHAGQAARPLDLSMLIAVHHGLRRDLRRLTAAAASTPTTDPGCWSAQAATWGLFASALEDHHTTEDLLIWPVLRDAATEKGDLDAVATLDAVEREHDDLEPLLDACSDAYRRMQHRPESTTGSQLGSRLRAVEASLEAHLRHEEAAAVPLLHTYLAPSEWRDLDAAHLRRNVNRRLAVRLLPWLIDELPAVDAAAAVRGASPTARMLLPLARHRHRRRTARALTYLVAPAERRA